MSTATATACNHTLRHDDPGSSWQIIPAPNGKKVVCQVCGRFYAYMPPARNAQPLRAEPVDEVDASAEAEQGELFDALEEVAADA